MFSLVLTSHFCRPLEGRGDLESLVFGGAWGYPGSAHGLLFYWLARPVTGHQGCLDLGWAGLGMVAGCGRGSGLWPLLGLRFPGYPSPPRGGGPELPELK